MVIGFLFLGHWGGLTWYVLFIKPLEAETLEEFAQRVLAAGGNATLATFGMPDDPLTYSESGELVPGEWWWVVSKVDPEYSTMSLAVLTGGRCVTSGGGGDGATRWLATMPVSSSWRKEEGI